MRHKNIFFRVAAAALCLSLLLTPAVQALTPQQALILLENFYIDELPAAVYDQTTISGMLNALGDPYTEYFSAESFDSFMGTMSDTKLVGIGVMYTAQEDGLLLSDVLPGSPAEEEGLQPGDVIVAVDGHSTKAVTAAEASGWIQGEEGTKVRITYVRGDRRFTHSLTRATVVVPATTAEVIDGHIGYIQCTTFGEETVGHFREAIEAYGDQVSCWIVDLRDNSGGVTNAATEAAGLFTGPGRMSYFRNGTGEYSVFQHEEEAETILPVIVLTNENTASASEIFAAAIQASQNGIIIGDRSYGKGVAQVVWDKERLPEFFPEGDAIKITSYRFFSPLGNTNDQVGVVPDVMVPPQGALELAWLLASGTARSERALRIDLGYGNPWRWYVDLDVALAEDNRLLFCLLLSSLPSGTALWSRDGKDGEWKPALAHELCAAYGLADLYTTFPDLADSNCPQALDHLRYFGFIGGREDGAFHPQDALTRAELCQLLAEALSCAVPDTPSPFSDVSDDAWYTPAVIAVSQMGLVSGVGGGAFHPEEPVDHQQLFTVMARLAQWLNMRFYNTAKKMPPEAVDSEVLAGYSEWARPAVWLLTESQTGLGGTISLLWDELENIPADDPATRDEAAFLFYNLLVYTGILPV